MAAKPLTIVALSGGVDSSVAALLLKEQGHEVQGLYMTNWTEDEEGYCTAAEDFQDALKVAERLQIPLHHVNFAREYRDQVFQYFLDTYKAGYTPNPDVLCNREIKFGVCLDYAHRLGGTHFATGHYARVQERDGQHLLCKALDGNKDQSYFLHAIDAAVLPEVIFPIGNLTKDQVRARAQSAALPIHDKPDSTGICFIGERPFQEFLSRYLPAQPGRIETPEGEVIGDHQGLMYHTLGQRQGLKIGGRQNSTEEPWYVAAKDLSRNVLIAVQGHDHPLLLSRAIKTDAVHWLLPPSTTRFTCTVKTRYRQPDQTCEVELHGAQAHVTFTKPQRAVTPGQFAVFYQGEVCLGGAVIRHTT